jgi:hypothetical protein
MPFVFKIALQASSYLLSTVFISSSSLLACSVTSSSLTIFSSSVTLSGATCSLNCWSTYNSTKLPSDSSAASSSLSYLSSPSVLSNIPSTSGGSASEWSSPTALSANSGFCLPSSSARSLCLSYTFVANSWTLISPSFKASAKRYDFSAVCFTGATLALIFAMSFRSMTLSLSCSRLSRSA